MYTALILPYCECLQPVKKKTKSVYFCPHCKKDLSWKTYSDHQRLYFNPSSRQWINSSEMTTRTSCSLNPSGPENSQCDAGESPPPSPIESLTFFNPRNDEIDVDPPEEGMYHNSFVINN